MHATKVGNYFNVHHKFPFTISLHLRGFRIPISRWSVTAIPFKILFLSICYWSVGADPCVRPDTLTWRCRADTRVCPYGSVK